MAKILIAEDEETLRSQLARALLAAGHAVKVAPDGAVALEALGHEPFDLLLADIQMPVMDGIALALAAARDYPALVVMLMTGYADQRERACGLDALIHDVLTKPFTLAELRQAVDAALAGTRPAGGLLKTF
jgi:two-component system, cell cycle response regulator CpdR